MEVISQSLQIKHNKAAVFLLVLQDILAPAPEMVFKYPVFQGWRGDDLNQIFVPVNSKQ